jgi:hypothetical protein
MDQGAEADDGDFRLGVDRPHTVVGENRRDGRKCDRDSENNTRLLTYFESTLKRESGVEAVDFGTSSQRHFPIREKTALLLT